MEATARATAAIGEGRMAVAVVGGTFVGIAERFVGFAEFLELVLGGMIARVFVRVEFHRELAVGLFDRIGGRVAGDAENLVIIAFFGHELKPRLLPRMSGFWRPPRWRGGAGGRAV